MGGSFFGFGSFVSKTSHMGKLLPAPIRYAIDLDLRGKGGLVVGLGAVGRRKALGLLEAGAWVRGVDPLGWDEAPAGVLVVGEPYQPGHLQGVFLVFAAATAAVNRAAAADALASNCLVCSTSEPESGSFTRPAVWHDRGLILTVSTSGASPALAAALRDRAAEALGPSAAALSALLRELRPRLFDRLPDPAARRRVLADWGDPRWLLLLESGGADAVTAEFERILSRELK